MTVVSPPVTRTPRLFLILGFALLWWWRHGQLVLEPRFFAEEFSIYFQGSHIGEWHEWMTRPYQGYLSILPNLGTGLARSVSPLERAPLVTTLLALLVQGLVVLKIVTSRASLFAGWPSRSLGLAALLMLPGARQVQASLILSQYHLTILATLMLLDRPDGTTGRIRSVVRGIGLFLIGVSSPVALFLVPAWAIRAWKQRSLSSLLDVVALGLAAALQAIVITGWTGPTAFGPSASEVSAGRTGAHTPGQLLASTGLGLIARAAIGPEIVQEFVLSIPGGALDERGEPTILVLLASTLLIALFGILVWRSARDLFAVSVCLFLPSAWFSLTPWMELSARTDSSRYHFAPAFVLYLSLLATFNSRTAREAGWKRTAAAIGLMAVLATGTLGELRSGPIDQGRADWRQEVTRWRADPSHAIEFAPVGWKCQFLGRRIRRLQVIEVSSGKLGSPADAGRLTITPPRLGSPITITLTGGPPQSNARLCIGSWDPKFLRLDAPLPTEEPVAQPLVTEIRLDRTGSFQFTLPELPRDLIALPHLDIQVQWGAPSPGFSNHLRIVPDP